ncbi:hypothetical protein N7481_009193 [Penicillium waksmanii]|uniref:uncharacterized protein n=1 Tax=Penicillium waksmanii TaxID=69791 RepID=UPI002546B4DC|nr:uncharacterized protein N7481_009193 [Penicillium waksmanii]KAJ5975486.1 hypothetical protein N7481_009193 [Penicillium waksmanii]
MQQFISPFPSLTRRQRQTSDTSSPPSSRTTSPPSSPTSNLRPFPQAQTQALPNHLFNLSFHPNTHQRSETYSETEHSQNHDFAPNPTAGTSHPHCGVSVLPCAVLRGRSSMMVVRRRPSAIDLALSEERSRCTCDSIERQGLDLMEPRPVDMDLHAQARCQQVQIQALASPPLPSLSPFSRASAGASATERNSMQHHSSQQQQSPRFVMGGHF